MMYATTTPFFPRFSTCGNAERYGELETDQLALSISDEKLTMLLVAPLAGDAIQLWF